MPVRALYAGLEAVEGTLAVTKRNFPINGLKIKNTPGRKLPKETTGTRIRTRVTRKGGRHSEVTITTFLYFDLLGYFISAGLGDPVTTSDPGGALGTYKHVWKGGGQTMKTLSLQCSYNGIWRQVLGARVNTMKITFSAVEMPTIEIGLIGRWATFITTPTVVPFDHEPYVQPAEGPQQSITRAGAPYKLIRNGSIEFTNNMEPDWTVQESQDAERIRMGDFDGKFNINAFFDAFAASNLEDFEGATGQLDAYVLTVKDGATTIGTGSPGNPKFVANLPIPLSMDGDLVDTDTDNEETISGELGNDDVTATSLSLELWNEQATYAAS
jgi:hypothetical protein